MTTPQRPINSGFTADSTIADVLAGIDLTGRLAIVTGGYSGIGTAVTRGLSKAGATVVVAACHHSTSRERSPWSRGLPLGSGLSSRQLAARGSDRDEGVP
jgi:NAD(P)-dependent dehydrogenase (short-subunit alcohol dehydrogenase family)